jgi:cytochrome c
MRCVASRAAALHRTAWAGAAFIACMHAAAAQSAARGQELYEQRCVACHSVDAHRIGPMHAGVFGRRAGSAPGYDYSAALARAAFVWDDARLDAWLRDPEALVPGQKMGYSVPDAADRADLIAYLKTLKPRKP